MLEKLYSACQRLNADDVISELKKLPKDLLRNNNAVDKHGHTLLQTTIISAREELHSIDAYPTAKKDLASNVLKIVEALMDAGVNPFFMSPKNGSFVTHLQSKINDSELRVVLDSVRNKFYSTKIEHIPSSAKDILGVIQWPVNDNGVCKITYSFQEAQIRPSISSRLPWTRGHDTITATANTSLQRPVNEAQKALIQEILTRFNKLFNIQFCEVAPHEAQLTFIQYPSTLDRANFAFNISDHNDKGEITGSLIGLNSDLFSNVPFGDDSPFVLTSKNTGKPYQVAFTHANKIRTITHEIGHALGLVHPQKTSSQASNKETIMAKSYKQLFTEGKDEDVTIINALQPTDIITLSTLYDPRPNTRSTSEPHSQDSIYTYIVPNARTHQALIISRGGQILERYHDGSAKVSLHTDQLKLAKNGGIRDIIGIDRLTGKLSPAKITYLKHVSNNQITTEPDSKDPQKTLCTFRLDQYDSNFFKTVTSMNEEETATKNKEHESALLIQKSYRSYNGRKTARDMRQTEDKQWTNYVSKFPDVVRDSLANCNTSFTRRQFERAAAGKESKDYLSI